jgi:hypothetical protein
MYLGLVDHLLRYGCKRKETPEVRSRGLWFILILFWVWMAVIELTC